MGVDGLFHLAKSLGGIKPPSPMRLDLVTRGAQPAGEGRQAMAAEQAPLIGLLRVVGNECPNIVIRVHRPARWSLRPADEAVLWGELLCADKEREVAFRGEARYVQRLMRVVPSARRGVVGRRRAAPARIARTGPSRHVALRAVSPRPEPGAGEVAGPREGGGNELPRRAQGAGALSRAKRRTRASSATKSRAWSRPSARDVTHVGVGDRVFGLAMFGLASLSLARGGDIRRIPGKLVLRASGHAAGRVYDFAWHAVQNVARMRRKGETILVHAGSRWRRHGGDPDRAPPRRGGHRVGG